MRGFLSENLSHARSRVHMLLRYGRSVRVRVFGLLRMRWSIVTFWSREAVRKWRSYVLVVLGAYVLTLAFGILPAPMRTDLENLVFDQYQRWLPRPYNFDQPVRIVDIDDESIHLVGRWPWSRQIMAQLVEALAKANVAAIGLDVLFSEKDRPSDDVKACAQGSVHRADDAERCERRADSDLAFAHAVTDRPVVFGTLLTTTHNGSQASFTTKAGFSFVGDQGEPPTAFLSHLSGALVPIPALAEAASGLGFLNWLPDGDRLVRRVPLMLDLNGQIQPSLAIETLRVAQGASSYVVKSTGAFGETSGKGAGIEALKVGDVVVPTQADGTLRVWFAKSDPRRSIPAWKVLQANPDLSDLAGKIVFVGASASLLGDIVATPLDPSTPGVEAHAQLIEQILSGVTLERPDWAPGAELAAGALVSLVLTAILPFIPIYGTALVSTAAAGLMAWLGWFAFTRHGVPARPSRAKPFGRLRIPGGCWAALWAEAPSGKRDPFRLRKIRLARHRRPSGRASRTAPARRAAARADAYVLRHPIIHHLV